MGGTGFAGTIFGECCSPSATLGIPVAECFFGFAECLRHTANNLNPVVIVARMTS
jgi:hypothetical protein